MTTVADTKIYYHFTGPTLRDGRPLPAIGEWLEHTGPLVPCKSGFHVSPDAFDALQYAPGPLCHRVEVAGEMIPHGDPVDKYVVRRRKIVATIDATDLLHLVARQCALDVIHLWDAPAVVREYLDTGSEELRVAAWEAAARAAWAARNATQAAAREAAREAVRGAAREAMINARIAQDDDTWAAVREAQRQRFNTLVDAEFAKQESQNAAIQS